MKKIVIMCLMMSVLLLACGGKEVVESAQVDTKSVNEESVSIENDDIESSGKKDTDEVSDSAVLDILSRINSTDEIKVKEAFFSLGKKKYTVSIMENDEYVEIAEIKGKYARITGDVFTMKDMDGNILASEKQIKRWGIKLNRLAVVYDHNEEVMGYIGEELDKILSIGSLLHFYNDEKDEIAIFDQANISLTGKKFSISKVDSDELDYKISKKIVSTSDTYVIEVIDSSIVSPIEVIFSIAIDDAISDAAEEEKKMKKKKKSN